MAPEVINRNFTEKCDLWSIGVTLYELITKTNPFTLNCEKKLSAL